MEKEKISFSDVEQDLDKTDYEVLSRLADNKDFQVWCAMVENFQLKRAVNFISGGAVPEDITDPVSYYRGGYDMYVKMMRPVTTADQMLEQYANEDTDRES